MISFEVVFFNGLFTLPLGVVVVAGGLSAFLALMIAIAIDTKREEK